jgi:hypothetical protein
VRASDSAPTATHAARQQHAIGHLFVTDAAAAAAGQGKAFTSLVDERSMKQRSTTACIRRDLDVI